MIHSSISVVHCLHLVIPFNKFTQVISAVDDYVYEYQFLKKSPMQRLQTEIKKSQALPWLKYQLNFMKLLNVLKCYGNGAKKEQFSPL